MKKLIYYFAIISIVISCSKDNVTTTPDQNIKSESQLFTAKEKAEYLKFVNELQKEVGSKVKIYHMLREYSDSIKEFV